MSNTYSQGIELAFSMLGVNITPVDTVAINYFANRTPIYSRFPHVPEGALNFKVSNVKFRPSKVTIASAVDPADNAITLVDASTLLKGDVIELGGSESVLILADPNLSTNAITVQRGYGATTPIAAAANDTAYLIGNARTGGETEQKAISRIPTPFTQNLQTIQHPVQVAGNLESATSVSVLPGVASLVGQNRLLAMQEVADDYERSAYYGRGSAIADVGVPQMTGLRSLLQTNNTQAPTNAASYKPDDLIRDTLQPCYDNGGHPDLLVVATNFMRGLTVWGQPAQRIMAGTNIFGMPFDTFEAPFLTGVSIIPAPLLKPGTVICLTSSEVANRVKRAMFDKPRGSRGDAVESDIIMEAAIDPENEHHHAWVSGITGFAAS
jgi:hypothetical protein